MSIVQLSRDLSKKVSFWDEGFRIFFLSASIFSILSITSWMFLYCFHTEIPTAPLTSYLWHGHEMIFGFTLSVISGFLLTAVPQWTASPSIRKTNLVILFLLWSTARICFFKSYSDYMWAGFFDLLFCCNLLICIASPIIRTKSWRHLGVMFKVLLLCISHVAFYSGIYYKNIYSSQVSLYVTIYLIISLVMTISSRVIPGYLANTLKLETLPSPMLKVSVLIIFLFILFFINQLFLKNQQLVQIVSATLSLLVFYRLYLWHDLRIWKYPLVWGLFAANFFIALGFLFYFLTSLGIVSENLAIHAFAYGGIGFSTLSMMSRVTLGHSNANVFAPPKTIQYALLILFVGILFRLCLPIIEPRGYVAWIFLSQIAWIISFILFIIGHLKYLIPRNHL